MSYLEKANTLQLQAYELLVQQQTNEAIYLLNKQFSWSADSASARAIVDSCNDYKEELVSKAEDLLLATELLRNAQDLNESQTKEIEE